jgi:hypothetical protein
MVFVIFVPRGLAGATTWRRRRGRRDTAPAGDERALGTTGD